MVGDRGGGAESGDGEVPAEGGPRIVVLTVSGLRQADGGAVQEHDRVADAVDLDRLFAVLDQQVGAAVEPVGVGRAWDAPQMRGGGELARRSVVGRADPVVGLGEGTVAVVEPGAPEGGAVGGPPTPLKSACGR